MAPRPDFAGSARELPAPPADFLYLLEKEVERSRRYYRSFALVRVEGGGSRPGSSVPPEWAHGLSGQLRRADVVTPSPNGALYVLLPETPASSLPLITKRLREALLDRTLSGAPLIRQAAFPRDGDSAPELLGALAEVPA